MVTYAEHLNRMLRQVLDAYAAMSDLKGVPLEISGLKRELLRINGLLRVIISNVPESSIAQSDYGAVRAKISRYLAEYDFEQELDSIEPIYSEDAMRITNIRIKVLEALNDRKMIESIGELADQL